MSAWSTLGSAHPFRQVGVTRELGVTAAKAAAPTTMPGAGDPPTRMSQPAVKPACSEVPATEWKQTSLLQVANPRFGPAPN